VVRPSASSTALHVARRLSAGAAARKREQSRVTADPRFIHSTLHTGARRICVVAQAAPAGYKASEPMLMWEALRQATDEVRLVRGQSSVSLLVLTPLVGPWDVN
jgi:hypothetical protein